MGWQGWRPLPLSPLAGPIPAGTQRDWPLFRSSVYEYNLSFRSFEQSTNIILRGLNTTRLVGMQVYDLPPRAAPRLPYYGWEWRQVGMLGQDRLPVGDQVTDRGPRFPWYCDWAQNFAIYHISVQFPFNQYDWPVPRSAAADYAKAFRDWTQYNVNAPQPAMPGVVEWDLPRQPTRLDQTWISNFALYAPTGAAPFAQTDWPLQAGPPRLDQTWTWRQVGMLGLDQLPVGEQVYDLAPKAPPRLQYYGTEWRQVGMLGQDKLPVGDQITDLTAHRFVPFRPEQTWTWRQVGMLGRDLLLVGDQIYDLPPKPVSRLPYYGMEWNQTGMLGQDRLPKNQYDWPLPNRGPYKIEQTTTWRQVGMLGQDQLPVGEQVTDLPTKAPLRAADLYTWIQTVNLALNTTPVVLPFNQYDWPLPQPQPRQAISWTWRQVDKIGRDQLPFNQFDWPLPNRGPAQFTRSWEWRQVDKLGRDRLPVGDQVFDLPNRGLRLALYDWIQSVNLALTVKPAFPFNQFDWPLPNRGPAQPDRSFIYSSQFIPAAPPFVGAQYFLLQPHYINNAFLDAWTVVTEGRELPIGWIPTLMVDPLNSQAVDAFYAAGPRTGYPGPGYDWQGYQTFTARRSAAIQSPVTHWQEVSPGLFNLTGLGAGRPPVGE